MNSFGVFQNFYESSLLNSQSSSNISWIGSFQTFLILVGAAIAGPLFDRGYLRALIWLGSFLVFFGTMMVSFCTQYWQVFLAQGIAVGIGLGCLFLPSVAVIAHYFDKKKSTALGIASVGGSLGKISNGFWEIFNLTIGLRRYYLPYCLPTVRTTRWFRLGNPYNGIYNHSYLNSPVIYHECSCPNILK